MNQNCVEFQSQVSSSLRLPEAQTPGTLRIRIYVVLKSCTKNMKVVRGPAPTRLRAAVGREGCRISRTRTVFQFQVRKIRCRCEVAGRQLQSVHRPPPPLPAAVARTGRRAAMHRCVRAHVLLRALVWMGIEVKRVVSVSPTRFIQSERYGE
jgi:hypothetical protein